MVELHIKIRKRIARLAYGENFVSYNEGYKIIFDFDKEWDSIENKTARFIFGENYIDYPFNGNEVEIPLIKNADTLEIGVYSDNLYTTTAVKFKVLKSIKDEEKIEILVPEAYPEIEELDDEDLIRVYDKSEEKIGISPLKKLFDKMGVAIDDALTRAKESGEFDGKSAYSYAVDGGYTGTEAEFAAKLAAEKLPNPYPLTFTGAVSGSYDGSSAKTIEIPSGGGGETIIAEETVLASGTIATETEANAFTASGITFGMLRNYKHWTVEFKSTNQNTYLAAGYKIGSSMYYIGRLKARNIKFQFEWMDNEQTIIRVFVVGGSGYGYGVLDIAQSTGNSEQASMIKQDQYIIADAADDTVLGFFNYDALTNDILWRVKGVFKYGNSILS